MKRLIFIILISLPIIVFSQRGQNAKNCRYNSEEIKAEKVSYLTNKLDLTVEEAQGFWPVYNEFQSKNDELISNKHEAMRSLRREANTLTDAELEKLTDLLVDIEIQEAQLKKEYHTSYKSVLPINKVSLLYRYEREFRKYLLEKYRSNGMHKGNGNPPHPKF